ncbi:C-type lectin domain family 4 member M isoform X2 [Microcaecilia unicolor]|uniref:C-type lectin domain family 4 member M-like isoform X2 n=1 Tax=Microcaecilia unicolor TaxID=1415580 RepID=A0A6P7X5D9_9AMPH|nr:C-type lectin domain family 4 member M-like isoform X2 [Microcaecilia unicolor]
MAEAVTYAELRFTKPPPWKAKPFTSNTAPSEVFSEVDQDGEIIYANISRTSPEMHRKREVDAIYQTLWKQNSRLILALCCLFLLATTMGLVGKLFHVSQHLEEYREYIHKISYDHENLSSSLALSVSTKESTLIHTEQKLRETEQELNRTQKYLEAKLEDLNHFQQQLTETRERLHQTEETLSKTREDLSDSKKTLSERENTLQETQETLRSTKSTLVTTQMKLRETERSMSDTKNTLRATNNNLSSTQKKLSECESSLSKTSERLTSEQQGWRQTEGPLLDLKEKWSKAQQCVFNTCSESMLEFPYTSERFKYCPSLWILLDGKCYFFSEREDARIQGDTNCKSRGSRLVTIKDSNTELKIKTCQFH